MSHASTPIPHSALFFAGFQAAWRSVFAYVLIGTYIGIAALAHDFGFSLWWVAASTFLLWVAPGQVIQVERLGKDQGAAVEFTKVLLVNNEGQVTVEPKALASAKVVGQVVAERKGGKVLVVKFKRRKNYRRRQGHRQSYTAVRITRIEAGR